MDRDLSILLTERIKELLKNSSYKSINQFCKQNNISNSTFYSFLNGKKAKAPNLITIDKICKSLNISIKEFFDDEKFS